MPLLPERTERIARLVARPSVSSAAPGWDQSNAAVIDELANWLTDVGFRCEQQIVAQAPEKRNLIATLGRGDGGLVLAGHTDTVPFDLERWTSDPFQLREADGKLVGLGTADMKAFLALAAEVALELDVEALKAPLVIIATADEESSMDGARALAKSGIPGARNVVIGEPTDLSPVRAHKGVLLERVTVLGRTGHSSDPRLGASAIDAMMRVLAALDAYRHELAARYQHRDFAVSQPTLNFGRLMGGDSANRIAGECALDFDVRLLPGMGMEEIRSELRMRAEQALVGTGCTLRYETLFAGTEAHELRATAPLLQAVEALTQAPATTVAFGTEAPYFAGLGADVLVWGPGGIAEAHRPDEFVRLDRLEPTVRVLRQLCQRFCY